MAAAETTAPSVLEGKANNVTVPALPKGDQLIALDRATTDRRSNAPVLFYGPCVKREECGIMHTVFLGKRIIGKRGH